MRRHKNRYGRQPEPKPEAKPTALPEDFPQANALRELGLETLERVLEADEETLMAELKTTRRYYRFKALAARALGEEGLESTWLTKLAEEPGTALAADFPAKDKLAAFDPPYLFVEDLDGADIDELTQVEGIGRKTAEAILAIINPEE